MATLTMTREEYEKKYGVKAPVAPSVAPVTPPSVPTSGNTIKMTRAEYQAKYGVPAPTVTPTATTPTAEEPDKKGILKTVGGAVVGMGKGLATAPATLIARPVQAVQSAVQLAGMDIKGKEAQLKTLNDEANRLAMSLRTAPPEAKESIKASIQSLIKQQSDISNELSADASWKPSAGGIVAAAPENWKDVKKDVGRGIETVALGLNAPMAAGAAFGVGSSLEQGNDLFSSATLISGLTGLATAKVLSVVGKPIFNFAGKAIGKVTPQSVINAAKGGAAAVEKFMASTQLPTTAVTGPLSRGIQKGAVAFDATINKGLSAAGGAIKKGFLEQYPAAKLENRIKSAQESEAVDFARTVKSDKGAYMSSNKYHKAAKDKLGIDLEKEIPKKGITYDSMRGENNNFDTAGQVEALRADTLKYKQEVFTPSLEINNGRVRRVPVTKVVSDIEDMIKALPGSKASNADKTKMIENLYKEYYTKSGTLGKEAIMNGLKMTDIDAAKMLAADKARFALGGPSDSLIGIQKEVEAKYFKELLEEIAPPELNVREFNKVLETNLYMADWLEKLNNKPMPLSFLQKTSRVLGKVASAGLAGSATGNILGSIMGYQLGGVYTDMLISAPRPMRAAILRQAQIKSPEAVEAIKALWKAADAGMKTAYTTGGLLPAPKTTSKIDTGVQSVINKQVPTGYNPDGTPITNTAIEMGYTPTPVTPGKKMVNEATQNRIFMSNTPQISAPSPRTVTPNTFGTPNVLGVDYGTPDVMGLGQKNTQDWATMIAEWKRSGTKLPLEQWIIQGMPEGKIIDVKAKRIFKK